MTDIADIHKHGVFMDATRAGNGSMGHGSNGSQFWMGHMGHSMLTHCHSQHMSSFYDLHKPAANIS